MIKNNSPPISQTLSLIPADCTDLMLKPCDRKEQLLVDSLSLTSTIRG